MLLLYSGLFFLSIAFVHNILRWDCILKAQKNMRCGWGDTSLELEIKAWRWSIFIGCVLGAFYLTFLVLDLSNYWPEEVMIALSAYDGPIVNMLIVIGYAVIYKRLKHYYQDLIEYSSLNQ